MSVSSSRASADLAGVIGGFAPLDSGILVPTAYLPTVAGLLHNLDATVRPTVNDDVSLGYSVGSMWIDTVLDFVWVCIDATDGAARWRMVTPGELTTGAVTLTASTTPPTIGNGTLSSWYQILSGYVGPSVARYTYKLWIRWTFGSTSAAGSGQYIFDNLPFTQIGVLTPVECVVEDQGTTFWTATGLAASSDDRISGMVVGDTTSTKLLSNSSPIATWAVNDSIHVSGTLLGAIP